MPEPSTTSNADRTTAVQRIASHAVVAAGFAVLAIVWTYPLVFRLATYLPGPGEGDNVLFLWNFWWMRKALASGSTFFFTPYQMAPVGADLTLHTHTALPAFLGATLLGALPIAAALNVTTLLSLALNGFSAYLLAWRVVRRRSSALIAGVVFATSPYIAAHLNGHFNLIAAWVIPLFALGFVEAVRGRLAFAFLAGGVLAATAYIDYYYVVYELALGACVLLLEARDWSLRARPTFPRRLNVGVTVALIVDAILIGVVLASGGMDFRVGPLRVIARDTFNLRQIGWLLVVAAVFLYWRPAVDAIPTRRWRGVIAWRHMAVIAATFLVVCAPILWRAARVVLSGGYVTQKYFWRNAPVGIDLLTLFGGNPYQSVVGDSVSHFYARFGIDAIESGAWLGVLPVVLVAALWRSHRHDPDVRYWTAIGGVFFVWSLGSHVHAAGQNTAFIAPGVLLRYVPFVSNARMPGRALVLTYLAVGILSALAVDRLFSGSRRRTAAWITLALVLLDFSVTPFPTASLDCPAIYTTLRARPESGALVELPLGLGDGFGELSPVDHRMFVCQTIHERRLVGGVLARLPPDVLTRYRADPLISTLLRLSGSKEGEVPTPAITDPSIAARTMAADDISFVMLNQKTASAELRSFVENELPVTAIADDGERTLFVRRP